MEEEELNRTAFIGGGTPTYNTESIEPVTPEVIKHQYQAPFNSNIGKSSVDLSNREANATMLEEYNNWWNLGLSWGRVAEEAKPERERLRENWYQKYHGMSYEDYTEAQKAKPKTTMYGHTADLQGFADHMDGVFQGLSAPGLGLVDFGMDAIGLLGPWGDSLDDRWDKHTKLDDPFHQAVREISSVVLPSILTGNYTAGVLNKAGVQQLPWLQKLLINSGAWIAESQIIAGISDTSEDHNLGGALVKWFPDTLGPEGSIPLPEAWVTLDEDSPAVRKKKNQLEAGVLSFVGVILGHAVNTFSTKAKKTVVAPKEMDWYVPLDDTASKYKQTQLFRTQESDALIRIQEINEILSMKKLSKQNENILINELVSLEDELDIIKGVDDAARRFDVRNVDEIESAKRRKIENPDQLELDLGIDPDIDPGFLDEASKARQTPPSGNVARNMADTTAIKLGNSTGDPAPLITEAMREKGLMVGPTSRGAVMGVAEVARDAGRFDALVDGFRYSKEQMNSAAWGIYQDIISADNMDDVRALFLENRDVKNMLLGRFKVESINEEQARAAAFAMRDLVDRFLGREVTESSARVMDTLGREVATLGEAMTTPGMSDFIDDERVMNLIIDKMLFLMDEYALNKYISGWQLRNKNWFDQVPPGEFDQVTERIMNEFTSAENAIHAKNKKFTKTLKALKKKQPEAVRPLVDAFTHTNGDVDSLAKLYKWAEEQVTPWGAIRSPNPKEMNLFARGLWANHMNNTLSGKAPLNAAVGNLYQIIAKPMTSLLGHGFWSTIDRNVDGLRRTIYFHGGVFETNRRAITDAWRMMKKAHKSPDAMLKAYRKDFVLRANQTKKILEDMRVVYENDGNWGMTKQIDLAITLNEIGQIPALRYGMTALVFPDAYASTMLATYVARMKAYDEVFYEFGFGDMARVKQAEHRIYKEMFDENGLPKDPVLKAIAGEVQLNLDDGLSRWLNEAVTAYPASRYLLMFPRTQNNWVKAAASWTPISLIPGMNRYSKTIYARTDDQIARALMEHGIDMTNTPNANVIFEQLRAEYTGRLMFSGMITTGLFHYAMSGNIRGNGHYNASRRMKERDQYGYEPKTINIGGKWISYEGIPGIEQTLSVIGDLAYYADDLNEPMLENWQSKLMWTVTGAFNNDTPLASIEPLIAILNNDLSGFNRLVAQIGRTFIPMSSGLGVLSEAIDSAQKDIQGEIHEYLMNRLPGFKSMLPSRVNPLGGPQLETGPNPNDPWAKIAYAINPFSIESSPGGDQLTYKTSSGKTVSFNEVMHWLRADVNYTGLSKLNMDSTGSYKYSSAERQTIFRTMYDRQVWQQLAEIMTTPAYQQQLEDFKKYRNQNKSQRNDKILLKLRLLPVYKEIAKVIKREQLLAEKLNSIGGQHIIDQQLTDRAMEEGNVPRAEDIQKQNLLKYNNN